MKIFLKVVLVCLGVECSAFCHDMLNLALQTHVDEVRQNARPNQWFAPGGKLGNNEYSQPSINELKKIVLDATLARDIDDWCSKCVVEAYSAQKLTAANRNWIIAVKTIYNLVSNNSFDLENSLNQIEQDTTTVGALMNKKEFESAKSDVKIYFKDLKIPAIVQRFCESKENPERLLEEDIQNQNGKSLIADVAMLEHNDMLNTDLIDTATINNAKKTITPDFKKNCDKLIKQLKNEKREAPAKSFQDWLNTCNVFHVVGLKNEGNTCYFNSTIQALYSCDSFRQEIEGLKDSTSKGLKNIFSQLGTTKAEYFAPKAETFLNSAKLFGKFPIGTQHDAQELLDRILDKISLSNSDFNENLFAKTQEQITTSCCKKTSEQAEVTTPIFQLALSNNSASLEDLFDKYFKTATIDDYNCYQCNKKVKVESKVSITREPKLLILQLVRFKSDLTKVNKPVSFSEMLNLNRKQYKLKAVVRHSGIGIEGGHYIADVLRGGQWYTANDSSVTPISKPSPDSGSCGGYLFFYELVE